MADSDIVAVPSTVNNVATINNNRIGTVGFDTEVLQFITTPTVHILPWIQVGSRSESRAGAPGQNIHP